MDELNKVHLRVDLTTSSSFALYDFEKLIDGITEDITEYFKANGIKFTVKPIFEGGGGGGAESIIEAFRYVLSHKEIITLLIAVIRFIFTLPEYVKRLFVKLQKDTRPRILVNLELETNRNVEEDEVYPIDAMVVDRLLNLKNISDDVHILITKKRPSFLVDTKLSISVYQKAFQSTYLIPHEKRSTFNMYRLVRFIKEFKLKNDTGYLYEFYGLSNLFLSSRLDYSLEYVEEHHFLRAGNGKDRKYFFLISSKNLRE